jgi:hypothetical protein
MKKIFNTVKIFFCLIKNFSKDVVFESRYKILDLYECDVSGFKMVVVKLSGRHIITKKVSDIIIDNDFIEGFDQKTIRTLTYLATTEKMKPDYSINILQLGSDPDDYIFGIKSKGGRISKTLSEMSKDKLLLSKLSPLDANRIGYLAGIRDTVKEFTIKIEQ